MVGCGGWLEGGWGLDREVHLSVSFPCLSLPWEKPEKPVSHTAFATAKAPTFLLENIYRAERKIKRAPFLA